MQVTINSPGPFLKFTTPTMVPLIFEPYAAGLATGRRSALPFDDAGFDVDVCQFGVIFFPDRIRGYAWE
jgi:hypothetical protein